MADTEPGPAGFQSAQASLGELSRILDRLQESSDASRLHLTLLTLAYIRATDETGWTAWREAVPFDLRELEQRLRPSVPFRHLLSMAFLRDAPTATVVQAANLLDSQASDLGGARTFDLLLTLLSIRSGRRGHELQTPPSVGALVAGLVEMESATTVYDPFCRSGELLVAAAGHASAAAARSLELRGTVPDGDSQAIAEMNLAVHGLDGAIDRAAVEDLLSQPPRTRGYSRILANPPYNRRLPRSSWWRYEEPPRDNANFGWLQRIVDWLDPDGIAGIVMPKSTLFSASTRERHIRTGLVEDGCVEALITLPSHLFAGTSIPAAIWLLRPPRPAARDILFINASDAGDMTDRTRRELDMDQIGELVRMVRERRSGGSFSGSFGSVTASLQVIRDRGYNLDPSAYLTRRVPQAVRGETTTTIRRLLSALDEAHRDTDSKDAAVERLIRDLMS